MAEDIETGALTTFAEAVGFLGNWAVALAAVAAVSIVFAVRGWWLEVGALVAGIALTQAGIYITKAAVDRPRPLDPLVDVSGSSFPSGHAATVITYVALAVVLSRLLRSRTARVALVVAAAVVAVVVGLSRVYLRVHYLSDVSAGGGLGLAAFSLCGAIALVVSHLRNNGRALEARPVAPSPPAPSTHGDG
jgi:membrane-associated phospholipid phosphatase